MKKKLLKIFVAVIVAASVIIALIAIMNPTSQMPRRYKTENFNRGVELIDEGKLEESLTYFEAELKEHPKNPYAHLLIAMVYTELEKYDNAKVAIENAIKYIPKRQKYVRGMMHSLKASIHHSLEEWEEAIKELSLCLSELPNDKASNMERIDAYTLRGEIYNSSKQYELAEQDFRKAEEIRLRDKKIIPSPSIDTINPVTSEAKTSETFNDIRFAGWGDAEWCDNEYIRTVRKYIDAYNKGEFTDKNLDKYKDYIQGKFVAEVEPSMAGGAVIYIVFCDHPEKVFYSIVYSSVNVQTREIYDYKCIGLRLESSGSECTKEDIKKGLAEHPEVRMW